jgi:hypothetical protein
MELRFSFSSGWKYFTKTTSEDFEPISADRNNLLVVKGKWYVEKRFDRVNSVNQTHPHSKLLPFGVAKKRESTQVCSDKWVTRTEIVKFSGC